MDSNKIFEQKLSKVDKLITMITLGSMISEVFTNQTKESSTKLVSEIYDYLKPMLREYYDENINSSMPGKNCFKIEEYIQSMITHSRGIKNDIIKSAEKNKNEIDVKKILESTFNLLSDIVDANDEELNEQKNKNALINYEAVRNKYNLTDKEIRVVKLVVKGYPNKDVGKKLEISLGTVKRHIYNIFNKVGIDNRTHLFYRLLEI